MCDRCTQQTVVTGQPTRIWVHGAEQRPSPQVIWVGARLAEIEWALMELTMNGAPPAINTAVTLIQAARAEVKRARQAQEATR